VVIVADDTDIFLLLYFCNTNGITCTVLMQPSSEGRSSLEKHKDIIPNILGLYAISRCDSVASIYGVDKLTALKVLKSRKYTLAHLGDQDAYLENVVNQATKCMLACFGQSTSSSLTGAQQNLWAQKVGHCKAAAPSLCSLPPTTEAFTQNVLRPHLQMNI